MNSASSAVRKADIGLLEALAALALRTGITSWTQAAAVAFGVALPALPVFKHNYLLFLTVLIVLLWMKLRGETWASIGLIVPAKWGRIVGYGVLLFVVQMAVDMSLTPMVQKYVGAITGTGAPKVVETLGALKGNLPLLMLLLPVTWLFAAFGEEVFYRGYLMTRFAQFMGEGRAAWGVAMQIFGRNLWPAIIAHGLIDTMGLTLLYLGLYDQHA